jgi:hypothetical protein
MVEMVVMIEFTVKGRDEGDDCDDGDRGVDVKDFTDEGW